jgi:hypothetical protein
VFAPVTLVFAPVTLVFAHVALVFARVALVFARVALVFARVALACEGGLNGLALLGRYSDYAHKYIIHKGIGFD